MRRAGKKRHVLTVQKPSTSRDSFGRPSGDWVTVGTLPGSIRTLSGSEAEKAHQLVATATHIVNVRYSHNMSIIAKHRFLFGDRKFYIGHVDDVDEVKRELDCLVSEQLA